MKKGKIILDTNIWVSYFFNGKLNELSKIILDNELSVFTTSFLIDELKDVLSREKIKKKLKFSLDSYIDFHQQVTEHFQITEEFEGCPDPKDNFLFDLAIQSKAKTIVTGDKKLLDFKTENISVISLSDFLQDLL
ncbi:putative toxin-antitoxin system toxin component, PIN family [Chryseobacterium sp. FH1]|uniref:putative toxin-antitoxin system toxin component, PIN family n=1 Tax=Chryseobacterium sp. FH1 TaxID=1233951 RepID=UPI0004E31A77|nr:putative toxin-antitoxin system toxin component, PIN family [Chryseobacterium sp. FH1]KFC24566.1 hypothetical protein IO90_00155 [Chryseobacterium sp. FH1]